MRAAESDTSRGGVIGHEIVKVQILAILRPGRVGDVAGFGKPIRPLFCAKIIELECAGILRQRGKIGAIGGNTRAEQTLRSGEFGTLVGLKIQNEDADRKMIWSLGENHLAAIW